MCLIVFSWDPEGPCPLLLVANRDEFHARPTRTLHRWPDHPHLVGGRDLEAGGTWLAVADDGRFAALTNIRDPQQPLGRRSRGELPVDFLLGSWSPEAYLQSIAERRNDYTGFNLLLGDARQLWHLNSRAGHPQRLEAGIHGVSNADLDTPWPKLLKARNGLENALAASTDANLFALMNDRQQPAVETLPHTGIDTAMERLLSSVFIASERYGTRATTLLRLFHHGSWQITERAFGPAGECLEEHRLSSATDQA